MDVKRRRVKMGMINRYRSWFKQAAIKELWKYVDNMPIDCKT